MSNERFLLTPLSFIGEIPSRVFHLSKPSILQRIQWTVTQTWRLCQRLLKQSQRTGAGWLLANVLTKLALALPNMAHKGTLSHLDQQINMHFSINLSIKHQLNYFFHRCKNLINTARISSTPKVRCTGMRKPVWVMGVSGQPVDCNKKTTKKLREHRGGGRG